MKKRALVAALVFALPLASSPKSDKRFQKKLGKDDQILHALDRLTFGPRPGDVERLKKIGLKKWIDQGAEYKAHWAFVKPVRPVPPGQPAPR